MQSKGAGAPKASQYAEPAQFRVKVIEKWASESIATFREQDVSAEQPVEGLTPAGPEGLGMPEVGLDAEAQ